MNDRQFECFCIVAQTQNFTDAARKMYSSQPTVSRLISSLEEELGFPLFYRTHKEVRLTASGAVMYELLSRQMEEFQKGLEQARNIYNGYSGTIKMGFVSETDLDVLWDDILPGFQKKHSNIRFSYDCCQTEKKLLERLRNGDYDLVILLYDAALHEELQADVIFTAQMSLVCGKNHPLAKKGFLDPEILEKSEIWTAFPKEKQALLIEKLYKHFGVKSWKIREVENFDTSLVNVRMGNGVLFIDPVTRQLDTRHYVNFPLPEEFGTVMFSAVWKKDNWNPALPLFLEYVNQNKKNIRQ